jgi:hypothetical protein
MAFSGLRNFFSRLVGHPSAAEKESRNSLLAMEAEQKNSEEERQKQLELLRRQLRAGRLSLLSDVYDETDNSIGS